MSVESMINLILAVVTGITAIIALLLTLRQIKLSNKQYLFERRLDKYLLIKDLLTLYKSSVSILEKETFFENVDFAFNSLVNCARLEDIYWVIEDPKDSDARKKFLTKCEGLERSALEIILLWKGESGELISTFVKQYSDLLRALLRQQVAIKLLEKREKKPQCC